MQRSSVLSCCCGFRSAWCRALRMACYRHSLSSTRCPDRSARNVVLSTIGVMGLLLGGRLSDLLRSGSGDRTFHILFLVCAAVVAGLVLYAWWRHGVVFDNVRPEDHSHRHPIDDIRRLANHWPVYPALLIWLLWSFAPGTDTPLLYYLQTTLHATDTQWGEWNAIFDAPFVPTFAAFGVLCTRVSLRRLLVWGTVIGVPQTIPLLFIPCERRPHRGSAHGPHGRCRHGGVHDPAHTLVGDCKGR